MTHRFNRYRTLTCRCSDWAPRRSGSIWTRSTANRQTTRLSYLSALCGRRRGWKLVRTIRRIARGADPHADHRRCLWRPPWSTGINRTCAACWGKHSSRPGIGWRTRGGNRLAGNAADPSPIWSRINALCCCGQRDKPNPTSFSTSKSSDSSLAYSDGARDS